MKAMATIHDSKGGRVVELLIPFEHLGKTFSAIHIKPILFDHTLRWQSGAFRNSLALLASLTGEREATLRMLRYPDADRVVNAMFEMLPDAIRADVLSGQVPAAPPAPPAPMTEEAPAASEVEDSTAMLMGEPAAAAE
jgi:hypothetical protein